jgi:glycosyltransferase involved in cell wall biosynthesis
MTRPVIIYVHDLRASGVVTAALEFALWLSRRRPTILCAGYDQGLYRGADTGGAELVTLLQEPGRNPRLAAAQALRRLVRRARPAAIVSMGNRGHRSVLWGTAGLSVRTVYLMSNQIRRGKKLRKHLQAQLRRRWLIASAHRLVLVGRGLLDDPQLRRAAETGRADYIPNGVDLDRARQLAGAPAPHPWLNEPDTPVLISVGRISKQKNHSGMLDAAALAMRQVPCRLILLGDGPAEDVERLKRQAAELGIPDRVLFAGLTDNVFAWLARSRLFLLPSLWEGSSIALLEAMAVGTPVLASTQAGDASHVLEDGAWGVLVDAHDPAGIAEGILRQLGPEPVRPGNRAEAFSVERTHERYAELLGN